MRERRLLTSESEFLHPSRDDLSVEMKDRGNNYRK